MKQNFSKKLFWWFSFINNTNIWENLNILRWSLKTHGFLPDSYRYWLLINIIIKQTFFKYISSLRWIQVSIKIKNVISSSTSYYKFSYHQPSNLKMMITWRSQIYITQIFVECFGHDNCFRALSMQKKLTAFNYS